MLLKDGIHEMAAVKVSIQHSDAFIAVFVYEVDTNIHI